MPKTLIEWEEQRDSILDISDIESNIRQQDFNEKILYSEQEVQELKDKLRNAIADYMKSEGCDCCRNQNAHDVAEKEIAELLDVPKYNDNSGYNFSMFESEGDD